ncbi:MAG: DUF3025 domain-containing protein [Steroidobacteraceae bacterium]
MRSAPSIDWQQPWYASIKEAAALIIQQPDWLAALNQQSAALQLHNHRDQPLTFVEQSALPADKAYEAFISETGCVPTRDNLHDFLNALVWLSFPNIKRQLNALQATQIAQAGIGKSRGAARDAATIFDENSALLVIRDSTEARALAAELANHQWRSVFLEQRESFCKHIEPWLFGHALMEKLVNPYKAITAHAWPVIAPDEFFAMTHAAKREWLDEQVAQDLQQKGREGLSTACFTPLQVLGIPAWHSQQDESFYADTKVFRPKPSR